MKIKQNAYLFGPFVGSIDWEFYRFAPYAIYLKKMDPDTKIIVLTRSSRFDLYGLYADILVNLDIDNDILDNQVCFKTSSVHIHKYYKIADLFKRKYREKYEIIDHFYPKLTHYKYKIKWQFPRSKMDYDFNPRKSNELILNKDIDSTCLTLIDLSWVEDEKKKNSLVSHLDDYNVNYIDYENFVNRIDKVVDNKNNNTTGVLILLLKRIKLLVGNIEKSNITKLGLLLRVPTITIDEELTQDSISLLNPLKTTIREYTTEGLDENII